MEEHFSGKVAQKVVIEKDGKILLQLDAGDTDTWGLPGGRLNHGEPPSEGVCREVEEELGIKIDIGDIFYTEQFVHSRSQENHLFLIYRGKMVDPSQSLLPDPQEASQVKWISKSELHNQKIFPSYLRALKAYFR